MPRRGSRASESCCLYPIVHMLGWEMTCVGCRTTNWTCSPNNYMVRFTGRGKYNGKDMCLECLKHRIETS